MLMTMIKVCLYGKLYRPILSIQRGSPRSLYTQNKFVAIQEFVFRSGVTSLKALSAGKSVRAICKAHGARMRLPRGSSGIRILAAVQATGTDSRAAHGETAELICAMALVFCRLYRGRI